ncbi:hypothetical protein EOPP23_11810 [Endozoicomonas sp. OPT23]|uniref:hypothetical protein n=1 Tax=Endozoicomonas sp. OPT23 TaxID=2072845 RepID=UPI00129A8CC3|nr:hypothetical protein [Endozoicomonas sp. OPT23]MRI33671.1 hypothetical protein [Endozoicomonas sp. OPT23]
MFNLHKLLASMNMMDWALALVCLLIWVALTYLMGEVTEKKWGDRESGALVGFFVPGLLFALGLYFV